jgi:quinohemoprotein ethanol dehydrogenase
LLTGHQSRLGAFRKRSVSLSRQGTAAVTLVLCSLLAGAATESGGEAAMRAAREVDDQYIEANSALTRDWPSYGLDYSETRFSRLGRINIENVRNLGLIWSYNLESSRAVEATPLVIDGVMYVTAPWSVVHAIDARSGAKLWTYDPQVPRSGGWKACCDVVNRGVALYKGKVFVGTVDARLVAIDASNGEKVWEQDMAAGHSYTYTSTGAPRVYKGKVLIGVAGGEYGARGYVTAYDAETGAQKWRWFTVPGDPSKPFENAAMAKAAKTWDPSGKYWETGGGGTTWNAMAYDSKLNLIYIGTDNGSPWSARKRSPRGGDNLYTCSIVALNADTGEYVWHYQNTPADNWDFSAVQDLILADLMIDGSLRHVVMQAPKNGFFFIIDRATGEFISAKKFVDVNWASRYDARGRPVETLGARAQDKPYQLVGGTPVGAHNWQSMSWSPTLGLAYIPAQNEPIVITADKNWKGFNSKPLGEPMSNIGWNLGELLNSEPPTSKPFGRLIAWDPVKQAQAWSVEYAAPWNGGTLATAGNLVFQGSSDGRFIAYNGKTGEKLWDTPTGTGIVAAPATYEVDGRQYVTIAVGWGGTDGQIQRFVDRNTPGTIYTYALGGNAKPPAIVAYQLSDLIAGVKYKPEDVPAGKSLYISNCFYCHGVPGVNKGGDIPNLGYVSPAIISNLETFVFKGPLMPEGMPDFTGRLTRDNVEKLKAFIQGTADAIRPTGASR